MPSASRFWPARTSCPRIWTRPGPRHCRATRPQGFGTNQGLRTCASASRKCECKPRLLITATTPRPPDPVPGRIQSRRRRPWPRSTGRPPAKNPRAGPSFRRPADTRVPVGRVARLKALPQDGCESVGDVCARTLIRHRGDLDPECLAETQVETLGRGPEAASKVACGRRQTSTLGAEAISGRKGILLARAVRRRGTARRGGS